MVRSATQFPMVLPWFNHDFFFFFFFFFLQVRFLTSLFFFFFFFVRFLTPKSHRGKHWPERPGGLTSLLCAVTRSDGM